MIFKDAERMETLIGFDPDSGLHLDKAPAHPGYGGGASSSSSAGVSQRQSDVLIFEEMDTFMNSEERSSLSHPDHIAKLQELLDKVITAGHAGARKKR